VGRFDRLTADKLTVGRRGTHEGSYSREREWGGITAFDALAAFDGFDALAALARLAALVALGMKKNSNFEIRMTK
jgi:hypothetical protein